MRVCSEGYNKVTFNYFAINQPERRDNISYMKYDLGRKRWQTKEETPTFLPFFPCFTATS